MGSHHGRFAMIVCPYPLIVRGDELLLVRRKNSGYMDGYYSLPAGHEEEDEPLMDCLVREAKEEVGITIDPSHPQLVHVMHRNELDVRLDCFFLVTKWEGTPSICEPEKCDEIGWFSLSLLPTQTVPYIREAIQAWQQGALYQQIGW